jgi:uncharacterized beta-barrel protein YwiB (DUF1934 family)
MLKKVRIRIVTDRTDVQTGLFDKNAVFDAPNGENEHSEMTVEGRYHDDGIRVAISYDESELSGMEGSRTTISYQKNEPGVITMLRTGSVKTALLFEKGRCHECVYQTPIAHFDVRVQTDEVNNSLEGVGVLYLDYTVELKGAQPQRTKMTLALLPSFDKPQGM